MVRETCPAILMITALPAPDSASSVTSMWRLSWWATRPCAPLVQNCPRGRRAECDSPGSRKRFADLVEQH
jgi:hypothetical protein